MAGVSRGAAGEVLAARFMRDKGYTIVASNYRCRQGEIDIIATDKRHIVFVEVKTRRNDALYAPREAVNRAKQKRLLTTAGIFLAHHETTLQPRFDVVEVVTTTDGSMKVEEINHIMGAYEAGDLRAAF